MKVSKLVTLLAVAGIPVLCKKRKSSTTSSKIVGTTTILDATTTAAPAIVTTASSEIPTNTSAAVDYFTVTSLTPEQIDVASDAFMSYLDSLGSSPEYASVFDNLATEQLDATAINDLFTQTVPGSSAFSTKLGSFLALYPTYARSMLSSMAYAVVSIGSEAVNAPGTATVSVTSDTTAFMTSGTLIVPTSSGSSTTLKTKKHSTITSRAVLPRKTAKNIANTYTVTSLTPEQVGRLEARILQAVSSGSHPKIMSILGNRGAETASEGNSVTAALEPHVINLDFLIAAMHLDISNSSNLLNSPATTTTDSKEHAITSRAVLPSDAANTTDLGWTPEQTSAFANGYMSALYSIVDSFMARADWRDMATLSAVKTGSGYNELTSLLHATTITNVQDLSRPLGHMPSIASEYLSKVLAAEISLTSKIKNMGSRTTMRTKTKRQDTDPDYPYTEESSYSSMVAQIHDEANDNVDYLSSIIGDQVSIELSSMIATMLPEDQEYLSSIIGDQISIELSSMIATMLPEDQDYLSSIIGDQASIESIISANFANSSASKANKQVVNTKASAIASPTSKKNSAPSKGVLGTGALAICLIGVMVLL